MSRNKHRTCLKQKVLSEVQQCAGSCWNVVTSGFSSRNTNDIKHSFTSPRRWPWITPSSKHFTSFTPRYSSLYLVRNNSSTLQTPVLICSTVLKRPRLLYYSFPVTYLHLWHLHSAILLSRDGCGWFFNTSVTQITQLSLFSRFAYNRLQWLTYSLLISLVQNTGLRKGEREGPTSCRALYQHTTDQHLQTSLLTWDNSNVLEIWKIT